MDSVNPEKQHLKLSDSGTPVIELDGHMGKPVVEFDGDDWLSTAYSLGMKPIAKYPYNRWGWRDHGYSPLP